MKDHFDITSLSVIIITFVLFTIALFTKGFTHDLLLEAGVFLVSVKLIIMAYKNSVSNKKILQQLSDLQILVHGMIEPETPPEPTSPQATQPPPNEIKK